MAANPERYFPADYRQARRAFIAACEAAGTDAIARVHPGARGPDGKPLFIDSAALGPRDAKKALLLICGTHGVEGYFGSAVLTGLLREGVRPPAGARLVLVHALNPYGFAWNRRVNEDNVDLNRNFVDHKHPPANPDYLDLAGAVAIADATPEAIARADAALAAYAARHGVAAFQAAFSRGQYLFPKGLFFGGTALSWSHRMLRAILTEDLAKVERLVVIDCHTGLGPPGNAEMIVEDLPGSPGHARAKKSGVVWSPPPMGAKRYRRPSPGSLDQALAAWLPRVKLTYGVLEVGTVSLAQLLEVLRRDNWLHNFAPDQGLAPEITNATRAAFYPDQPAWKAQVFGHAMEAVQAALAAL